IDLTTALYACWRMGAVVVLIDSGLGPRNMSRAIASAAPDYLIGITKALLAARALRWPGARISSEQLSASKQRLLGVVASLPELERRGAGLPAPPPAGDDDDAAVVFTSGSTGPSKGVIYRHHQLQAQRDQLAELYEIADDDRLVAAFAPFALYGPALGITSAVPNMDLTKPGSLAAVALAEAVSAVDATLIFASPAALANVTATESTLTSQHRTALAKVRLLLSAGAPINADVLARMARVAPNAEPHTPYGMTEVLPVTDISLTDLHAAASGDGVCVGAPRAGVTVRISEVDGEGYAVGPLVSMPYVVGEVVVDAPHMKQSYDRLWFTEHKSTKPLGWHRTGDVGMLDDQGRLWIGGRLSHVITTAAGPLLPVAIEQAVESLAVVGRAAAVGVGPAGNQLVVIVVEVTSHRGRIPVASIGLRQQVRDAVSTVSDVDVAAVLVTKALPTDKRHNAKIGRTAVAEWASQKLAGKAIPRL
ncbi:MAG: AMP-binding protein, partial [Acidimicrobiales bacterium]